MSTQLQSFLKKHCDVDYDPEKNGCFVTFGLGFYRLTKTPKASTNYNLEREEPGPAPIPYLPGYSYSLL